MTEGEEKEIWKRRNREGRKMEEGEGKGNEGNGLVNGSGYREGE